MILADQLILLAGSSLLMLYNTPEPEFMHILCFLISISFSCFVRCCNMNLSSCSALVPVSRQICGGLCIIFALLPFLLPSLGFFLPFLAYELRTFLPAKAASQPPVFSGKTQNPDRNTAFRAMLLFCGLSCTLLFHIYTNVCPWLLAALCGLAFLLSYKTAKLLEMEQKFHLLRDTSTEYQLLLKQKNQTLIKQQDYEIHVATLKERNRIAREIHDNVGHMLSRSLLQAGALIAVNCQENLKEPLNALKDTLGFAMDAIRQSVHGLHDDSIHLEQSVRELFTDFSSYEISFEYDMGRFVPAPVKYCLISIVKESLSNIARHSNATAISITLREHPVFYQLIVADNGTAAYNSCAGEGMGIANMRERIASLNGHFSITTEHGFQIFASIPICKNEKHE